MKKIPSPGASSSTAQAIVDAHQPSVAGVGFKPVLSLSARVWLGLAFVGPPAPYPFLAVGAVQSPGHFPLVYLTALVPTSFPGVSYGKLPAPFP